ncbi:hypothetical protein LV779_34460 [Streptomyces thinghirensis]|nr:hypothetical protein [Streptomyces thinghirensis]
MSLIAQLEDGLRHPAQNLVLRGADGPRARRVLRRPAHGDALRALVRRAGHEGARAGTRGHPCPVAAQAAKGREATGRGTDGPAARPPRATRAWPSSALPDATRARPTPTPCGACCAPAPTASPEVPADRWDHDGCSTRTATCPAELRQVGRLPRRRRPVRPAALRHLAARGETMDPGSGCSLRRCGDSPERSGVRRRPSGARCGRRVGVYVGAMYEMYRADTADVVRSALTSAASYNLIANRVSHFFGLEGRASPWTACARPRRRRRSWPAPTC